MSSCKGAQEPAPEMTVKMSFGIFTHFLLGGIKCSWAGKGKKENTNLAFIVMMLENFCCHCYPKAIWLESW